MNEQKTPKKRFSVCLWFNKNTMETMYGIKVKLVGWHCSYFCCEGDKPLLYKTREECETKIKQVRKDERKAKQLQAV